MANTFQDDDREKAMVDLFSLYKAEDEGRSGVDAFLDIDGKTIPFELKTTSKGSVTTVRDFGPDHIKKWVGKHWLFGFFMNNAEYYLYGSPLRMEAYVSTDFKLAEVVPAKINFTNMYSIIGKKSIYSFGDAYAIQKKQYKKKKYIELQDVPNGYTPKQMLEIVRERTEYLIKRGSTLNNPHIPFSYFNEWEKITSNHSERLHEMVRDYFKSLV